MSRAMHAGGYASQIEGERESGFRMREKCGK